MFKKTVFPVIIGVIASVVFATVLVAIPCAAVLISKVPIIGYVILLLTALSYYVPPVFIFLDAFIATLASLRFISFATRYDRDDHSCRAAKKASVTEGTIITLFVAAGIALAVSESGFSFDLFSKVIPFLLVIFVIFNSNK